MYLSKVKFREQGTGQDTKKGLGWLKRLLKTQHTRTVGVYMACVKKRFLVNMQIHRQKKVWASKHTKDKGKKDTGHRSLISATSLIPKKKDPKAAFIFLKTKKETTTTTTSISEYFPWKLFQNLHLLWKPYEVLPSETLQGSQDLNRQIDKHGDGALGTFETC